MSNSGAGAAGSAGSVSSGAGAPNQAVDNAPGSASPVDGAKPYFELAINNTRLHIDYVLNGAGQASSPSLQPQNGHAVAWLEEKDQRKHYFWFKLQNKSYVLAAKYFGNTGFDAVLTLVANDSEFRYSDARSILRLKAAKWGLERTRQNESRDVKVYRHTVVKAEGDPNSTFEIRLRVRYYKDDEVGGSVTNPIVVVEDEE